MQLASLFVLVIASIQFYVMQDTFSKRQEWLVRLNFDFVIKFVKSEKI